MKRSFVLLILTVSGLLSCKDDEPDLPLTPGLITKLDAFDLGNAGNAGDIRVEFKVKDNLNIF